MTDTAPELMPPGYLESEKDAVRRLGDAIGYGRTMQLCEEIWREIGKKKITLGWYKTEVEAVAAYQAAFKMTEAFDVRCR